MNKAQARKLIQRLQKYDHYYWSAKPIVPDSVYDTDYLKLKKYRQAHPDDSAAQQYFAHLPQNETNTFKQIRHTSFMGSLDKIRTKAPLVNYLHKWSTNPRNLWNTSEFLVESKLDGLSGVCYFNVYPGRPFVMLTRGGGYYGNDITPEAKYLRGMDINKIRQRVGNRRLIVRGELIMSKASFNRINRYSSYANSRNAVSGVINSKHPIDVKKAGVYLNTYTLVDRQDWRKQYPTELSQLKFLKHLGFFEDLDVHVFKNPSQRKNLAAYCLNYTHAHRMQLNFDIDGLTIKPNNTRNFIQKIGNFQNIHKLGYNHHGPVHSKAWKFPPKAAVGIFDHVDWQPSAGGRLSPVGVLRAPVRLFGSTITKASLGSLPNAQQRDLRIGDHVLVRKMNDVIPKFIRPIRALRTGKEKKIQAPQGAIVRGKYVYAARNQPTRSIYLQRWRKFVSKPCLNIRGLSINTIEELFNYKLLDPANFSSLWELTKSKLLALPNFGPKKANNLLTQRRKAKQIPLDRVLLGLPIYGAGEKIIKPVAKKVGSFRRYSSSYQSWQAYGKQIANWLPQQKGFGQSCQQNVKSIFSQDIFKQLNNLCKAGFQLTEPQAQPITKHGKLTGQRFAITGKLSRPRKFFQSVIKKQGGAVQSSVNSKTGYLICNQKSTSSKYRKAVQLHTKIINENQFKKLIQ